MRPRRRKREVPYYSLNDVQKLVRQGKYLIRDNALYCAYRDFGWDESDIADTLCRLRPKHFDKTRRHEHVTGAKVDYYKARKLKGEKVYIHFYMDYVNEEKYVVLNSCKRLEE